jgi:hypothetical protein
MDLRTKLVFALVLVSLVSMLLLATVSYGPARDLWRARALETLDALAESKKMQIGGVVDGWENRVRLISGRSGLRRLTESFDRGHDESAQRNVARLLAGAQASLGGLGVHEISFLSAPRHAGPSNRVLTIADENAPIVRALQGADSTFYENTFDYRNEPV